MPARRKPKAAASLKESPKVREPRKQQARKSDDRPLRRAASTPDLLPEKERQAPQRDRCAVLHLPSQGEPLKPLVMWKVYKHPKDHPGEYVARKFLIEEASCGASNESISSKSLRDVRNVLRSLYGGLIQFKLSYDDEPPVLEVWL